MADHPIRFILVLIFAAACLVLALAMPWAELGMVTDPNAFPHTLKLLHLGGLSGLFQSLYAGYQSQLQAFLEAKQALGSHGEYVYALVMGLAMVAGAVAYMVVGSEEEVEKTILPAKK